MDNINEKLYNAVYCKKKRKLKKLIEKGANVDLVAFETAVPCNPAQSL